MRTKIHNIERIKNSVNGNPNYLIEFENNVSAKTKNDAGFTYGITTSWEGREAVAEIINGKITDLELID